MARAAVVDVAVDDDLNLFVLALLAGRPHVMSCSLFSPSKRRWVHRFSENFQPAGLTRLAAGPSLVRYSKLFINQIDIQIWLINTIISRSAYEIPKYPDLVMKYQSSYSLGS